MFRRQRMRRGPYAVAEPSAVPSFVRSLILLAVALLIIYYVGRGILSIFGFDFSSARSAVTLNIENNGIVNVSLDEGPMQRADDMLKLYAGDTMEVSSSARARLTFFDGSWIRVDGGSNITISESNLSGKKPSFAITVTKGSIFVRTPKLSAFSGSVVRTIQLPRYSVALTTDTSAYVDDQQLIVFSADGNGTEVTVPKLEPAMIGEGQQVQFPATTISADITAYRSAIDPLAVQKPFIQESRTLLNTSSTTVKVGSGASLPNDALVVTSPAEGAVIDGDTAMVKGTVGSTIQSVRINGHMATINKLQNSFSEELAFNDALQMNIQIQAMDINGIVVNETTRTVKRTTKQLTPPTITSPAKNGQTYRTQATQIDIKGTASADTVGIMVNDYKLQLYRQGDSSWSYLASTQLGNLTNGKNVINVYALDSSGRQSSPATLTILLEAGAVGVVQTGSTTPVTQVPEQADENTLPKNNPLTPGVLAVTSPSTGSSFTATGSEIVIAGFTSAGTDSIWINGYKLRLYKAGKTTWNYIANTTYGTLKRGTNTYKIVARDKQNQILDKFEYTVSYQP